MLMFLSEQEVAMKSPDGSICTWGCSRRRLSPVLVPMKTSSWQPQLSYLNECPIFSLRAFVELLLFPIAGIKNPVGRHSINVFITISFLSLFTNKHTWCVMVFPSVKLGLIWNEFAFCCSGFAVFNVEDFYLSAVNIRKEAEEWRRGVDRDGG